MRNPKTCVLRTAGTNCDQETAYAFSRAGAAPELLHVNALIRGSRSLKDYQILAIPGGFSYGDDIAAGKILANEIKSKLAAEVSDFIRQGKLVIGICNGFQVLVKSGLLPGNKEMEQDASLIINDSAKFEDRWVYLKTAALKGRKKCIWVRDLPEVIYLPVAHGEGKFAVQGKEALKKIKSSNQVVFRYCDASGKPGDYPVNPNGSQDNIAGICDESGRVLGLMPHPERHLAATQHPRWTQGRGTGDGFLIFKNGVEYARKNL